MQVGSRSFFLLFLSEMFSRASCLRRFDTRLMMLSSGASLSPPPEPINFGSKFFIPESKQPLELERRNQHPLDSRIKFESTGHKYYFDGKLMERSVTEVVGNYFEAFDADLVIRRMMTGNNWPRPEYLRRTGEPLNEEEIKKKWADIGEYARNTGTWMHYNIERYLNNLTVSPKSTEIPKFLKFYDEVIIEKKIQPYRTEWRIAAPDSGVAGSVDFVGKFPDNTYALVDWKRSKDLESNLSNKYRKYAVSPIEHIEDCDGSKYFLQLNIYKYILQNYYDMKVSYMAVASFHPSTGDTYFMTEVPDWADEVESIFKEISKSRIRSEQPDPAPMNQDRPSQAPRTRTFTRPSFDEEEDDHKISPLPF